MTSFNSVGRGRAGQDPAAVEALLPEHTGAYLRGGLERQRPCRRRTGRAAPHAQRGRIARVYPAGVRQQAGPLSGWGGDTV